MKLKSQIAFEQWLVLKVQGGHRESLTPLLELVVPALTAYSMRLIGDREGARESTQETCLAICRQIGRLNDAHRFRGWMFRIARNKAADWIRKRSGERNRLVGLEECAPAQHTDRDAVEADELRLAIRTLPPRQRLVLNLFYTHGLTVGEVATALGIRVGTIKSDLFRARAALKTLLEDSTDG